MLLKRSLLLKSKKAEMFTIQTWIFLVLNIFFFSMLLGFVYITSEGSPIYEEAYAKQIALLIDQSKPDIRVVFDFSKGAELAKKNKIEEAAFKNLVVIKDGKVFVSLGGVQSYSYNYFSDYEVSSYFEGNNLILNINNKK